MRRIFVFVTVILLAGCGPRAGLVLVPGAQGVGEPVSIFVATTRSAEGPLDFGRTRSLVPQYARYDISIPENRDTGTVAWPGRDDPDPTRHFLASHTVDFADAAGFRRSLRQALASRDASNREATIYVHGFNNNFADGVLRIAQMSHDFEGEGVAVHYSWPSAASPTGYVYDRDSALFARDGLESLIKDVKAAGAHRVILVAHSLGSLVTMEALRQMAIANPNRVDDMIDGVILISPDIDVKVFRSQVNRIGELPDPFGIFVSQRDRALALSARLTGEPDRLGNVRSVQEVADLDVTILNVTEFSRGSGHFTIGDSPTLIQYFSRAGAFEQAFRGDASGEIGLISGTVLSVQNATEVILSPVSGLTEGF